MSSDLLHHRLIVGYHGCDREVARRVLMDGISLNKSENEYDWLGSGIYFWEHGPERALDFAREQVGRGRVEVPAVLGAYIHLGACFDLTDIAATKLLRGFYEDLEQSLRDAGKELPTNRAARKGDHDLLFRKRDCLVLNFGLTELEKANPALPKFQTVRGVFTEGDEAFPGSKIMLKTHIQVAVRDPACILGYFLPKPLG